jgi:hypothetical protein
MSHRHRQPPRAAPAEVQRAPCAAVARGASCCQGRRSRPPVPGRMPAGMHRPPQAITRWSARSIPPGSETMSAGAIGPLGRFAVARGRGGPRLGHVRARTLPPAAAPQRGRPRLPPASAAQHVPEPEADREPPAPSRPATRPGRPRRRPAGAPPAGRVRGRRALRSGRRAAGRFPRRPRRRRHHRPLLQGGVTRPADP